MRTLVIIVFSVWALYITEAQVDQTKELGAHGPAVVETVVNIVQDLCIINNGYFLRRIALVESNDGMDPNTYRRGYNGGIWKVDEAMFNHTKFADGILSGAKSEIELKLSIDWNNVTWGDLRKPLFSGLAAALFIRKYANNTIDGTIEGQATLWKKIYRPHKSAHEFYSHVINWTGCHLTSMLDVAMVLDSSVSLSYIDLAEAKLFLKDIISRLPINKHLARVALMTFGTHPNVVLNFDGNMNSTSVHTAVDSIVDIDSSRVTAFPLTELLNIFKNGGRRGAAKYALLLTGSTPNQPLQTLLESALLAGEGIQIYAIGCGSNVRKEELERIVSGPVCNHVKKLSSYVELTSSLANEIVQMMCHVPSLAQPGSYNFQCGLDALIKIPYNPFGQTITISVDNGKMDVYGSFISKIPSKSMYDVIGTPSFGNPLVIYHGNNSDLFLTTKGTQLGQRGCPNNYEVQIKLGSKANDTDVPNPCQLGMTQSRFPHPKDNNKFLECDAKGKLHLLICPPSTVYCPKTSDCFSSCDITTSVTVEPSTTMVTTPTNLNCSKSPCIQGFPGFFPTCNESCYFDCGGDTIRCCIENQIWNRIKNRCVNKYLQDGNNNDIKDITNPCINSNNNQFFAFPGDNRKYIYCDSVGTGHVKNCFPSKVWHQESIACL